MNSEQNKYKKYLNKKVMLNYKVNGYTHIQHGLITKINRELLFFEPFELNPLPIIFSQIIEIKEI